MAKEKLEYEVEFPISFKGEKKALKDIEKLEKSFVKFSRNAQAASARINWGALAKSGTLGRTISNIATKNLTDFMPHKSFARAGANIGSSFGKKIWGADMAADYAEKYQLNRLAKGKSLTSKAAMTGVNKAAGRGMVAAGAKGAAMGGAAGGLLGGVLMLLPALIGIIVASSRMLQKTLGNIMKYLLMFLRPIGDMLAVLFYPLMMILRPLAMMVNTIIRPFLMEARKSFRLSLQLGKQAKTARSLGMTNSATELEAASKDMLATGIATLSMGFGKFIVNISAELSKLIGGMFIDVLAFQFQNIAYIVDALTGGVFNLSEGMQLFLGNITTTSKAFLESSIDTSLKNFNDFADDFLSNVKEKNEAVNTLAGYTRTLLNNISIYGGDVPKFDLALSSLWSTFKTQGVAAIEALIDKAEELVEKSKPSEEKTNLLTGTSEIPKASWMMGGDMFPFLKDNILKTDLDNLSNSAKDVKNKNDLVKNAFDAFGGFILTRSIPMLGALNTTANLSDAALGILENDTTKVSSSLTNIMIPSVSSLGNTVSKSISAIDAALTACKNSELKAKGYAESSKSSSSSKSGSVLGGVINTVKSVLGFKASGGIVSENGMYYLHKGENVTNPVSSSFNNTAGSSNSLPSIEFNNCTFGGTEDWKKKMDEYFNKQIRHIR